MPTSKKRLDRKKPARDIKPVFYLFQDGRNTEVAYFRAFVATVPGKWVEVHTDPGGKDPRTLARNAVKKIGEIKKGRGRTAPGQANSRDQVWLVIDHDDRDNLGEAISLCVDAGVKVAFSNPCFELWLILHEEEYDRPDGPEGGRAAALCRAA